MKIISCLFLICFYYSCQVRETKNIQDTAVSETVLVNPPTISIDTIFYSEPLDFKLYNFTYCDFVTLKPFKKIDIDVKFSTDFTFSTHTFIYRKDTVRLIYHFEENYFDRKITINSKTVSINRIIPKKETLPFHGFNSNYDTARFFYDKDYLLIESSSTHWTGLIVSMMRFCQLIDMNNFKCNEFFIDSADCSADFED